MTKLKSKKMSKSTFAIIIMAVVMVAMLAFGGTYAYFTATATGDSATFTTAKIVLTDNDIAFVEKDYVLPTDELVGAVTYTNASTVESIVVVKLTLGIAADSEAQLPQGKTIADLITVTLADGTKFESKKTEGNDTYYVATAATTDTSLPFASKIAVADVTSDTEDGTLGDYQAVKFNLAITARSIQAQGYTADTAITTLF